MLRLPAYRAKSVRHNSHTESDAVLHFERPQWFKSTSTEIGVIGADHDLVPESNFQFGHLTR